MFDAKHQLLLGVTAQTPLRPPACQRQLPGSDGKAGGLSSSADPRLENDDVGMIFRPNDSSGILLR